MLKKLLDNIGIRACRILGFCDYLALKFCFLRKSVAIFRTRKLVPIDEAMSRRGIYRIHHRFGTFDVNTKQLDTLTSDGNASFGAVRELYIRDCYFRGFDSFPHHEIKTAIDLGGNRGMVSLLLSRFCQEICIVEAQSSFNRAIDFNLKETNRFERYQIVNSFVGGGGLLADQSYEMISFRDLMTLAKMKTVDFLKVDIEGSEFGLFDDSFPYDKVRFIAMEVHRDSGDPQFLIDQLMKHGFRVNAMTSEFEYTKNPQQIDYLYASKSLT